MRGRAVSAVEVGDVVTFDPDRFPKLDGMWFRVTDGPRPDNTRDGAPFVALAVASNPRRTRTGYLADLRKIERGEGVESATVDTLNDGDLFTLDGGDTWWVCCTVLFGNIAVYLSEDRHPDAPTGRIDGARDAECLVHRGADPAPSRRVVTP